MSDDAGYKEVLPRSADSERNLFAEALAGKSGLEAFQRTLLDAEQHADFEDIKCAREGVEHLQALVGALGEEEPEADLNEHERETLHRARALASHSTEELFSILASVASPIEKGDALYAISALIEAAFYVGRCSTAAQEARMRAAAEQRSRTGRQGAEASSEIRQGEARVRQQLILTTARALLQAKPDRIFSVESLAAVLDGEMTWPKERFRKVRYSTIRSDLYNLVRNGDLVMRSKN